jgi:hypothetical protein
MACAQLQVVPAGSSAFRRFGDFSQPDRINAELRTDEQCVFAGDARKIAVVWHNAGDKVVEADVRARIYQTSSATTILLSEVPWKKLQVLPQQTVIESAQLDFPAVKAETKFLVQWFADGSGAGFQPASAGGATNIARSSSEQAGKMPAPLLGTTEVLVYPTNLLADLKALAGGDPVGAFDPQNQLKPLLKKLQVEFVDLEDVGLDNFHGKLAIIGPFQSKTQMREGLASQIQALAKKNTAVVWIQPPPEKPDKLQPSFYFVPENQIAVVIVQPDLVANLPESPRAQLNLVYFCQRALHHEPFHLPQSFPQP